MSEAKDTPVEIEVTPNTIEAGVSFVMDFFPASWGSETKGISHGEALAVVEGVVREMQAASRPVTARQAKGE